MILKQLVFCFCLLLSLSPCHGQAEESQSEVEQITETLMDYILGTRDGQPERLERAFHPDFNLYTVES